MADVWLAEHKRNGRQAAIKILKPITLGVQDAEDLFLREGQVLAGFSHINILKIYDNDKIGDVAYIVMEHLPGGTLLERMQRGPIRVDEALGLITQVASALEVAHRQQVIHRDLKPANVMLRDETTPVLTDFGAVRVLDKSTIYGREGAIIGTPIYMSPEQITGQTLTGRSDLYALGVMFHELLTGRLPFPGGSIEEVATQHLYAPIPQLPAPLTMLQPILEQLLAKKPEQRFASAQQFNDTLRGVFLSDEALRRQIGFSGTSMAWSSQLRTLGFALDVEQTDEVRLAQGNYLQARKDAQAPAVPGFRERRGALPTDAPVPEPAAVPDASGTAATVAARPVAAHAPASKRGLWLAAGAAGLLLAGTGGYFALSTPAKVAPVAAELPAPNRVSVSEVLAERERYSDFATKLSALGQSEQLDVTPALAAAELLSKRGVLALDRGRFDIALVEYSNARDALKRSGLTLLNELETTYAQRAQTALDSGNLSDAKQLVERGKEIRSLRETWTN